MTKTPAGDDIVILSRSEYNALVTVMDDDTADISNANHILARIEAGTETLLTDEEMDLLLEAKTPLAFWRQKRGLTQSQLSASARVAQGFLSEIENGNKTGDVHTLAKIARTLAISIDDLVVGEPEPQRKRVSHDAMRSPPARGKGRKIGKAPKPPASKSKGSPHPKRGRHADWTA